MNRLVNMRSVSRPPPKRPKQKKAKRPRGYRSELRDDQALQTRARILDGLVAVLNETPHAVTIPAVAKKARVSVPTVYRHFDSKAALMAGLHAKIEAHLRLGSYPEPVDADAFVGGVRELFAQLATLDPAIRSIGRLRAEEAPRRARVARRFEWMDQALRRPLAKLPAHDRTMMRDVLAVLVSSSGLMAFEDYLGLGPNEAAERIEWLVHTLVEAAERKPKKGRGR